MSSLQFCLSAIFVLVLCFSPHASFQPLGKFHKKYASYTTLYVDPSGHGNFRTIQAAIDHIPSNNLNWTRVYVKAGLYREQIQIPMDKPYIYIQGEGKWTTRVVWDGHESTISSPTFMSSADNIVVRNIAFINSYNYPPGGYRNPIAPAVAGMIAGDKSAFYRCAFIGFQDTLWDVQGRHYFKLCTIQGAVDFIFGAGQSIYDRCSISVAAGGLNGLAGFITAQARSSPNEPNGFVFRDCNVFGTGTTYLGRPWRRYARVIFYNTTMANIIVPQGWDAWNSRGHEDKLTFAECYCRGPGAYTARRVPWEYKLSDSMLKNFTDMKFIDADGWIANQAFHMLA